MGKTKLLLGLVLILFSLPAKARGYHGEGLLEKLKDLIIGRPRLPISRVDSTLKRVPVARLQELTNQKRMGAFKPNKFGDGWEDGYGIVWGKPGEKEMTHQEASAYCREMGASLPSKEQVRRLLELLEDKPAELSKIFPEKKEFWTEDEETRYGWYPESLMKVRPGQSAMIPVNNDPPPLKTFFTFNSHANGPKIFKSWLERDEKMFPAICVASYWTGAVE